MTGDFYRRNRQNMLEKMEDNSILLLYSGVAPVKSNDQSMTPFSPNRNFYYMTGIDEQNVWLMLHKSLTGAAEYLFIDEPDELTIKWNGKMLTREEASEQSGIAPGDIHYSHKMEAAVSRVLARGRLGTAYFSLDRHKMLHVTTRDEEYARLLRDKYPALCIRNAAPIIASLRAVKRPEEVDCIRKAIGVTIDALEYMLRHARAGEFEYQWAADYEYQVARAGLCHAFPTICAAGPNAVMLHYTDNGSRAEDGQLILFDLGAEYRYYSADISRTFPAGGRFTARQKELYDIVLEAMDVARDKMRPGEPAGAANQAVINFYKKALRAAKLITEDSEVAQYYYHGVAHSLGLDTHDPSDRTILEPGMVLTCEPGLYVAREGIGIRLENDILVTDGAAEDLAAGMLLGTDKIEKIMQA